MSGLIYDLQLNDIVVIKDSFGIIGFAKVTYFDKHLFPYITLIPSKVLPNDVIVPNLRAYHNCNGRAKIRIFDGKYYVKFTTKTCKFRYEIIEKFSP